jgi:hypothetical protein
MLPLAYFITYAKTGLWYQHNHTGTFSRFILGRYRKKNNQGETVSPLLRLTRWAMHVYM